MKDKNLALGTDGKLLDYSSESVKNIVDTALEDDTTKLHLFIAEKSNGDLIVSVMGKPDRRVYDILAQALEQYDNALKLNGK